MTLTALLCFAPALVKIILAAVSAAAFIVWIVVRRRVGYVGAVFIAAALSAAVSLVYFNVIVSSQTAYIGHESEMTAVIDDVTYVSQYASYADVRITGIDGEKTNIKAKLEYGGCLYAERDDIIAFSGSIGDFSDDGDFAEKRYNNSKGYYVSVSFDTGYETVGRSGWRLSSFFAGINDFCGERLFSCLDENALALSSAVFLGDKSGLEGQVKRDFRAAGVSHVLAVSGLHLSILIGGIYFILRKTGVHRKICVIITIILCLFYMGFTGAPPSILRSGIMFIIMGISVLANRNNDPVTSLFTAGAIILFFSPNTVFDAGFLLSFFATLGIVIISPWVNSLIFSVRRKNVFIRILAYIAGSFAVTSFAVMFTLPFSALFFGRISVLSPVTTLIVSPLISLLLFLCPLTIAVSFGGPIAAVFGTAVNLLCRATVGVVSFFAGSGTGTLALNYPFVGYLVAALCLAVIVMLFIPLKNNAWFLLPFACFIAAYFIGRAAFLAGFDSYSHIACMNSGKNDAVCLYDGGDVCIVDFSSGGKQIILNAVGLAEDRFYENRIDSIVLTHYHVNFIRTLDRVCGNYYVDSVMLPEPENDAQADLAHSIEEICADKGTRVSYYGSQGFRFGDSALIIPEQKTVSRSTHPVLSLKASFDGGDFCYVGASYSEAFGEIESSDAVYFGIHGPKQKYAVAVDASICTAVFANKEVNENYIVFPDVPCIVPDDSGFVIVRIEK